MQVSEARTVDGHVREATPRVVLVDDNEVFRVGFRELLEDYEVQVVGEGENGREAIELVGRLRPDIVVMDLRMPELDGIEAAGVIKERFPEVDVIMLSAYDDPALQQDAAKAAVRAYLVKGSRREAIHDAIFGVYRSPRPAAAGGESDALQQLTAAQMRLQGLKRRLDDPAQLAVLEQLDQAVEIGIEGLRDLMFEIQPPRREDEGLQAELRAVLERYRGEAGFRVALEYRVARPVPDDCRRTLFAVAREAIENAAKHAGASSVDVSVEEADGGVLVQVTDDGRGMTPADLRGGVGLASMRDRAESAGGWCRIWSLPGAGTTVKVRIPA